MVGFYVNDKRHINFAIYVCRLLVCLSTALCIVAKNGARKVDYVLRNRTCMRSKFRLVPLSTPVAHANLKFGVKFGSVMENRARGTKKA